MINYSIVMRSVNANLFEINQAKARIKQAEKYKVAPAQEDLDLVKTEVQNAYAIAQYADVMTIEKFARHISTHGCVYSRADISAILYMAVDCMREQLLEGKKIRLGDLGDFSVSLQSKGAKDAKTFSASNITGVNVVWDCGQEFKNLLADAEFNLVASRSAQAAVLKAVKAGSTTVDLTGSNENEDENENPDPDNNGGGGGQTPSPTKYSVTLSASPSNGGTVSGGGEVEKGKTATIKATPASGYKFVKWSDNNTSATRTITVSSNMNLVATFELNSSTGEGGGGGTDNEDDYSVPLD